MRRTTAVLVFALALLGAGCNTAPPSTNSGSLPSPGPNEVRLLFTYGSEKQSWVEDVVGAFNHAGVHTASGKLVTVQALPKGSGELVEDVLSGKDQADIASPASELFLKLGNARSRAAIGQDLIETTQSLVVSPVVIAMWKPMAEALGWPKKPVGWSDILELSRSEEGWGRYGYPQWGRFRFGHTHPEYSNSGLIALLAENYAAAGKRQALTPADATSPRAEAFVRGIEDSVVHYGSSTGFFGQKLAAGGPEYLSAAVLYENMVVESYSRQAKTPFPLVAVYPKEGTFWSDHPVGIIHRGWVTPERRAAAQLFLSFLLAKPQQEKALRYGFRPGAAEVPTGAPIDAAHGVDPAQPVATLGIPSTETIASVEQAWRVAEKKPADIALVLDTSGSMRDENKMAGAQAGAKQLVSLLGSSDTLTLVPFSSTVNWAAIDQELGSSRQKAMSIIDSLFADGGTHLYDAVDQAYRHLRKEPANRIRAVVVLTDGADETSSESLRDLLSTIRGNSEDQSIRIFTIAYGSDAERGVLQQIASSAQGKAYTGNPSNVVEVFRDISTFF